MKARESDERARIMAHMVCYYPDRHESEEVARGLVEGGAEYIEIQFPFSDPSADGPAIQTACTRALEEGFTVNEGFESVSAVHGATGAKIFIMSYASIVVARGVDRFCQQARDSGAKGLIVPDLQPGYDEGLYEAGRRYSLEIVPVVAPRISPKRRKEVLALNPAYLYASLRLGITGSHTDVGDEVTSFLSGFTGGVRILAGFGIHRRDQVDALKDKVHALVVGSAIVRAVASAHETGRSVREAAGHTVHTLVYGGDGLETKAAE